MLTLERGLVYNGRMKKLIVALCILCLCCGLVAGCTTKAPTVGEMSPVRLADTHSLEWDAVEGAEFYGVRVMFDGVNGYEEPTENTYYRLKLFRAGTYTLSVRAKTAAGYTDYSPAVTYVVEENVTTTPVQPDDPNKPVVVLRGSGTAEDPLLIFDEEDLAVIGSGMREVKEDGVTVRYQNYYALMADIDLGGAEWTPIGSNSVPFRGLFDGRGHTISNFTHTKTYGSSYVRNGLFSTTQDATIVNLNIKGYTADLKQLKRGLALGALIGMSKNTVIDNVHVEGNITVYAPIEDSEAAYIGMIVGQSTGTDLRHCSATGKIDVTFAKAYAGGLVGHMQNKTDYLRACLSLVDVKTMATAMESVPDVAGSISKRPNGYSFAGGLVGYASSVGGIYDCVVLGNIEAAAFDGTPAERVGQGMLGGGSVSATGVCRLVIGDCYVRLAGIGRGLSEEYPTGTAAGARYAVGNCTSLGSNNTAYGLTEDEVGKMDTYAALDMENTWKMGENGPVLEEKVLAWHKVTYQVEGETVDTAYVLHGHVAHLSPDYQPPEGYAVRSWDYSYAPITEDTVIVGTLRVLEE